MNLVIFSPSLWIGTLKVQKQVLQQLLHYYCYFFNSETNGFLCMCTCEVKKEFVTVIAKILNVFSCKVIITFSRRNIIPPFFIVLYIYMSTYDFINNYFFSLICFKLIPPLNVCKILYLIDISRRHQLTANKCTLT